MRQFTMYIDILSLGFKIRAMKVAITLTVMMHYYFFDLQYFDIIGEKYEQNFYREL